MKNVISSILGWGGAHVNDQLQKAVSELQSLSQATANGAAANTNIAVAGVKAATTTVVGVAVVDFTGANVTLTTATVPTDGNIQCPVDTTGKHLIITYVNG